MPLHLLKLAVGIASVDHLREVRKARAAERGGEWVFTRNFPRRAAEVADDGSIYWVIRGQIAVRQRVTGFRAEHDAGGRRYCRIEVDARLVPTLPRMCRAFQGWRYLPAAAAPADRATEGAEPPLEQMPAEQMLAELRELGLI
jgi:hypothetical protein